MKKLKGKKVHFTQHDFKVHGDLLYYDGPIFSHLTNDENENFLMLWTDQNKSYNRWLLYKTNHELLRLYFDTKLSDVNLIMNNPDGFVYFVDIDNEINWATNTKVKVEDIPKNYLPDTSAFFENSGFDDYAYTLKKSVELKKEGNYKLYKAPKPIASMVNEPKPTSPSKGK